jgi:hypothetical protein
LREQVQDAQACPITKALVDLDQVHVGKFIYRPTLSAG